MAEPARLTDPRPPAAGSAPSRAPEPTVRELPRSDRWAELRDIIVGAERERLARVERTLDDPSLGLDTVSKVLPEAVLRRAKDRALGDALAPVVGEAIKASVRRDPQPLVDAIFPVIGPAIRRAIAASFAELVQSLNTTLEHSFSPRGLAWRFEAMRSGRSFGEVVLSHSLLFRVEQLLVVHRETGLMVSHLPAPGVKALSPEMVAGMLTAITDFARDSFQVSRQQGLDSFALGDFTLWVEDGPAVALAAVIRGQPPLALRETMQQAVEGVQRAHASDLDAFGRDGTPFEVRRDLLEPCLVAQLAESSRPVVRWRLAALAALVLLGVGWCAVPRVMESRRFSQSLAALRNEPGVVLGSTGRANGRLVISGLRDPMARDPALVLAAAGVDSSRVTAHWEPYIALRPEFVLRRAGAALQPPGSVQLVMRHDTLAASGISSADWLQSARRVAGAIAGVGAVDFSAVRDSADVALRSTADSVERLVVTFRPGDTFPQGAFRQVVDTKAASLRGLLQRATVAGRTLSIAVRTTTDTQGSRGTNAVLRLARAQVVRTMLLSRGVPAGAVTSAPDSTPGPRAASLRIAIRPLTTPSIAP